MKNTSTDKQSKAKDDQAQKEATLNLYKPRVDAELIDEERFGLKRSQQPSSSLSPVRKKAVVATSPEDLEQAMDYKSMINVVLTTTLHQDTGPFVRYVVKSSTQAGKSVLWDKPF